MADLAFLNALTDASLRAAVASCISTHPDATSVFKDLISHFTSTDRRTVLPAPVAPVSTSSPLLLLPAISFSLPQRKKLSLAIYADHVLLALQSYISAAAPPDPSIVVSISALDSFMGYAHLPTPARALKSHTIVLISSATAGDPSKPDSLVFTVPDSSSAFSGTSHPTGDPSDAIIRVLTSLHIPRLDDSTTFFVDAHRGTKDGFLFFLPTGVLFGFKKPLWFALRDSIDAISYSSITRNTFNLTIAVRGADPVEFSMIDQLKFAEIDGYVKLWGLSDYSMAEEHRAKRAFKDNGQTEPELVKAEREWEQQIQPEEEQAAIIDDDDEEDENFEVDDEDDDGGSPSQSSSDDDN